MGYPHFSTDCDEYHHLVRNFGGPRPPIIVLCGSTRFYDAFQQANYDLTMEGAIVLSIGCDTKSDAGLGITEEQKRALDELHLRKIDLADEVFVLNVGGYVGESTAREVDYAKRSRKSIRWLEEPARLDGEGQ